MERKKRMADGKGDWGSAADEQEKSLVKQVGSMQVRGAAAAQQNNGGGGEEEPEKQLSPAEQSLLRKVLHTSLVENRNELEVQRKDPKSPLYSVKSFDALNLKPTLLKGVYSMGFNAPSKIQACVRWQMHKPSFLQYCGCNRVLCNLLAGDCLAHVAG